MSPTFRPRLVVGALGLWAATQLLAGCNDSVVCVFTTGCTSGGGAALGNPERTAVAPFDGLWIRDGRPTIELIAPTGGNQSPDTPIVIVFSESMNADTVLDAFELIPVDGVIQEPPVTGLSAALVGDGRMLVLLPSSELLPRDYILRLRPGADLPTDLTSEEFERPTGTLGSFAVSGTGPEDPSVLATFPPADSTGASDIGQIVVVFDRAMDSTSVNGASFDVLVDGEPPLADPAPQALNISGLPEPDGRVFLYRSADADDVPEPFAAGSQVQVNLSPAAEPIRALVGSAELPPFTFAFTVTPFATPVGLGIVSQPFDAIGRRNLTAGAAEALRVEVDLLDGEPGDELDLFLFGDSTNPENDALVALRRTLVLAGTAPIQTATLDRETIELTVGDDASEPFFADGPVSFAVRITRGTVSSPVKVLDVDLTAEGIQDPVLDTTAPTLLGLSSAAANPGDYFSDQRDIVVVGTADELLRSVEVQTDEGDNGVLPDVVGAAEDGRFVAAPVRSGQLADGETGLRVIAYDAAFNPSSPFVGTYRQLGGVGPGAFTPGDPIEVEVFDGETLLPLEGASVFVHADGGDGVSFPFHARGETDAEGRVFLTSPGAPAVGVLVTVDVADYGLFTFQGLPSTRLSVPVFARTFSASARVAGTVTTNDPLANQLLPGLDVKLDDSRRPPEEARTYSDSGCTASPFRCNYGPEPIFPGSVGAQSFLAGRFNLSQVSFNPSQLIQAFCLSVPVGPADPNSTDTTSFSLPFVLAGDVPADELPIELRQFELSAENAMGIELDQLVRDPQTLGEPRITVETLVPGVPGNVAVGLGLAYELLDNRWLLRTAVPGAVTETGFFGLGGVVDTDLFLRAELRDENGNVAGQRPRMSAFDALPVLDTVIVPNVPRLAVPAPGGNSGGASYTLSFDDTLPDASGQVGLYRVDLRDRVGRDWTLWRLDPTGTAPVSVHLPEIASQGGNPLDDGIIVCRIAAFSWPTLDPTLFLFSDVEREHDLYSRSEEFTFTQP